MPDGIVLNCESCPSAAAVQPAASYISDIQYYCCLWLYGYSWEARRPSIPVISQSSHRVKVTSKLLVASSIRMSDKLTRIALIKEDKCKPKKCRQECKRSCPVVRLGKECIEVTPNSKLAFISEELCIGCGICVKKCPFEAINIINLPKSLDSCQTHRYGPNSFKLHRLPMPRPGQVLGLVGTNGIGKSTALKILAGKQKPNLGRFDSPPDWAEILVNFRGSELQVRQCFEFFNVMIE